MQFYMGLFFYIFIPNISALNSRRCLCKGSRQSALSTSFARVQSTKPNFKEPPLWSRSILIRLVKALLLCMEISYPIWIRASTLASHNHKPPLRTIPFIVEFAAKDIWAGYFLPFEKKWRASLRIFILSPQVLEWE